MNKDNRFLWSFMCSLAEIVCFLEEKLGLFVGNSYMLCMLQKIFEFKIPGNFLNFLLN